MKYFKFIVLNTILKIQDYEGAFKQQQKVALIRQLVIVFRQQPVKVFGTAGRSI